MSKVLSTLKDWLPAGAAVGAVVFAVGYTFSRKAEIAQEIQAMRALASSLSETATTVERGVVSMEETSSIQARRTDLEQRLEDCEKPGLVVPQLSEAARASGLRVLEIEPARRPDGKKRADAEEPLPSYRVSVRGAYAQIAEYLQGCARLRIPVRVIGLRVTPDDSPSARAAGTLKADITVEALRVSEDGNRKDEAA